MKNRILILCGVIVVIGLLLSGVAVAITATNITNLTASELTTSHTWPDISGDHVVWTANNQVVLYTISTGVAVPISNTTAGFTGTASSPSIDGNKVVYVRNDTTNSDFNICVYTIGGQERDIVHGVSGNNCRPDISGDTVVYRNNPVSAWEIFMVDSSAASPTPVQISQHAGSDGNHQRPVISGNYVVYHTGVGDNQQHMDLWLYNIRNGTETEILSGSFDPTNAFDRYRPNISGDNIVYMMYDVTDPQHGIVRVLVYNVSNGTTRHINSDNPGFEPNIDGPNVVHDVLSPQGVWSVRLYNLATGSEAVFRHPDGTWLDIPAVSGNHVVWLGGLSGNDNSQIFMTTMTGTINYGALPGSGATINIDEGQTIWQNPYIIQVHPTSDAGIVRVDFYIDGVLIGTSYTPDGNGVYSWPWDTAAHHSVVRVVATDSFGETIEITRNTTVELPFTGN